MLTYLFNVVANYNLCKGFQVPFKKTAKDLKGKTTAITEEWCSRDDDTVSLYLRSVECRVLVSNNKRSCNVLCDHCATVKRNVSLTSNPGLEGNKSAPKKRESYMLEEELKQKLHQEQTRRKNVERWLNYLNAKIENEMKTFEEEDHKDFLHISRVFHKTRLVRT